MEKTYIEYKNGHCISLLKLCGLFIIGLFVVTNANAQENNADSLIRNQNEISSKSYKYTVKGNVIDGSTHLGFAGARINVVNEPISAMTEDDGSFEIKVPHLDVTLSIEAPGYQTQIVALKGRQELSVQMLKPVGETSFYDQVTLQAKNSFLIADFSPNIVTIDEDISSRLNGQLRSITHSGNPQGGSAIFVNGLNSLNTTAQPLYVVDGVIWQIQDDITSIHSGFYNNPLAVIDPADVEKITVMKNGTSIYGAKGANGVVFIDTKRGHSPSTEIAVDLSFGYRSPFNSISVMDAGEYRLYASDIISGMFKNTSDVEKRFKFLDDDPTRSYYKANHNNTDWVNLVNKDAWNQSYGIKVNGGDEVALYAFSLGYTNSEGNIKDSDFNRLNIRFNSDINLTDKFKVKFDIAFAQTQNKVWNDGMDSISSPYFLSLIKSPLYSDYKYNSNGNLSNLLSDTDEMGIGNPLAIFDKGAGMSKNYVLNANIRPSYSFLNDKIKVGVLFSYSWNKLDENSFVPDYGTAEYALYNQQGEVYGISKNKVQDRMDKHQSILVDGRVDWNIFKNSLNNFDVFAGYRFYSDTYKARYANGHNTGSDNTPMLQYTASELRDAYGIDEAWKSMSWYANADYSYKNKYFLNASAAMDASSRFGTDVDDAIHIGGASWGVFPSVMAGWLISSENFMEKVNAINFLKLNLGYGISGNDNLPNTATRSYFSSVKFNGKAYGLTLDNIGNEKLKWETTATAHIGLDASLFNNRWSIRGEYYSAVTSDLLTRKQLKEEAGLPYYWSNEGELTNKGYEIFTQVRILNERDWKLNLGASIGHYKNKITSLPNGTFDTYVCGAQIRTEEGLPAGVFYGYKTNGVFATKEAAQTAALYIQNNAGLLIPFEAGDMCFEDKDGNYVIDEKDKQIIGDPNPDFYGNFNIDVTWKHFTLGTLFTYSFGNDVYNALRANMEAGKNIYNQSSAMQNRWVANGQVTDIPRATYGDPMGNARFSDRWIEDGSYLKFKSISLSYEIPLQLTFLQSISVWGSVSNIYTFTKYLGSDPEFAYGNQVLYQGVDAGLVPQTRTYNFGIKINL